MHHRLSIASVLLAAACAGGSALATPIVWSGLTFTFNHPGGGSDPRDPANQDRITSNAWITRGSTQGIFNAAVESSYSHFVSPAGTEWAYGTTANYSTLTYQSWETTIGQNPLSSVGQNMVMHIIADDIYLDIEFLSWGRAGSAGEFSYIRAVPTPGAAALLGVGGLVAGRRRR